MRGKNQVWNFAQSRVARQRLLFENIERRPTDLPARQRFDERCLVDQATARAIDQPDTTSCLRQATGIEEMMRFGREWSVQRKKIGQRQKLIEILEQLHLKRPRPDRGKVRIVG